MAGYMPKARLAVFTGYLEISLIRGSLYLMSSRVQVPDQNYGSILRLRVNSLYNVRNTQTLRSYRTPYLAAQSLRRNTRSEVPVTAVHRVAFQGNYDTSIHDYRATYRLRGGRSKLDLYTVGTSGEDKNAWKSDG